MTRSTPDPVFAEAVEAELRRRARTTRERIRARSARPSAALRRQLVTTAAVAALIGGVLAGTGVLHTILTPTSDPASTPTAARSAARPSSGLIAPPGYRLRSDAELRAWGATVPVTSGTDRTVWVRQQILITHCMAGHGFLFDPVYRYEHAMGALPSGHEEAYEAALHGSASSVPASWRTLGCTGLAEHETGFDPTP